MRELVERAGKPDVAVIDPPRAGLSQKVVRRIIEAAPQRIVYVSCNPTTLAPNAAQLVEAGWVLEARPARRHVPPDPAHRVRRTAGEGMSLTRVSRFGFVNAFLVEEDGRADADRHHDPAAARKAILAAAAELGRPIVRIALTHAHGDHIGSLDALAAELPGRRGVDLRRATRGCSPRTRRPTPASRPRPSCAAPTRAPRRSPTRTARRRATASARSRSSPPRATPPATSPSSTPATAR